MKDLKVVNKKMHLLAWSKVCKPKAAGGVGLTSISHRNSALLGKWVQKWYTERTKEWNKWSRKKYNCKDGASLEEFLTEGTSSEFWIDVRNVISKTQLGPFLKKENFKWKVNDGKHTLFWEDHWNHRGQLKDSFPRLFALSIFKGVTVETFVNLWECYNHAETVFWTRSLRNWELELVEELDKVILSITLNSLSDSIHWLPGNGQYTVNVGTSLVSTMESTSNVVSKDIWKTHIPAKIQVFLWKLICKILPTRDFLASRIPSLQDLKYCSLCSRLPESTKHIFWQCDIAKRIWRKCLDWWGFFYKPLPTIFSDSLSMIHWHKDASISRVWKLTIIASIWTLWLSRNERIFKGILISEANIMILLQKRSQEWNLASNFISYDHVKWWEANPVGVVTRTRDEVEEKLLMCDCDFICFIDGAWSKDAKGSVSSGVGGIAKNTQGNTKMVFSGPHPAENAFMAEVKALETLVGLITKCG